MKFYTICMKKRTLFISLIMNFLILQILSSQDSHYNKSKEYYNESNENFDKSDDIFYHLYKILNVFISFSMLVKSILSLAIDIITFPYHICLFLYSLGVINFVAQVIYNIGIMSINNVIPTIIYYIMISIIYIIEYILLLITKSISSIYLLGYLFYCSIYYIAYSVYFIFENLFEINLISQKEQKSILSLLINFLNPFFVFEKFGYLSILIYCMQITIITKINPIIKKILDSLISIYSVIHKAIKFLILKNNEIPLTSMENLFDEEFSNEKIHSLNCSLCFEDYDSNKFYKVINFNDIKSKINRLLNGVPSYFKTILGRKFDNHEKLLKLSCNHSFHGKCIVDMINYNFINSVRFMCPNCRYIFN